LRTKYPEAGAYACLADLALEPSLKFNMIRFEYNLDDAGWAYSILEMDGKKINLMKKLHR
jgi:hypothetical protein